MHVWIFYTVWFLRFHNVAVSLAPRDTFMSFYGYSCQLFIIFSRHISSEQRMELFNVLVETLFLQFNATNIKLTIVSRKLAKNSQKKIVMNHCKFLSKLWTLVFLFSFKALEKKNNSHNFSHAPSFSQKIEMCGDHSWNSSKSLLSLVVLFSWIPVGLFLNIFQMPT